MLWKKHGNKKQWSKIQLAPKYFRLKLYGRLLAAIETRTFIFEFIKEHSK